MKCPGCGYSESKVIDSRQNIESNNIRRRRECMACQKRFTTFEVVESLQTIVIKKNGSKQVFDRQKLLSGLLKACEKRPVPITRIDALVSSIERTIYNNGDQEVTSEYIGDLIMAGLKEIDDVAYVRFASVYRQFKDIDTFMEEISEILSKRKND